MTRIPRALASKLRLRAAIGQLAAIDLAISRARTTVAAAQRIAVAPCPRKPCSDRTMTWTQVPLVRAELAQLQALRRALAPMASTAAVRRFDAMSIFRYAQTIEQTRAAIHQSIARIQSRSVRQALAIAAAPGVDRSASSALMLRRLRSFQSSTSVARLAPDAVFSPLAASTAGGGPVTVPKSPTGKTIVVVKRTGVVVTRSKRPPAK